VKLFKKAVLFLLIVNLTSCANIFAGGAVRDTDAARLVEARKYLDAYNWTEAIAEIGRMTSNFRAGRDVQYLLASAYVGRCGLDFFELAQDIVDNTSNLFVFLISAFPEATAQQLSDCVTAEGIMNSIGSASARTDDENVLMAFIGLATAAVHASNFVDTNGNGIADDGVNPCGLTNASANEVVVGIVTAVNSLAAAGGVGQTLLADVQAMCTSVEASLGAAYNVCNVTTTASVTMQHRQVIRAMIAETTDGFGVGFAAGGVVGNQCGT